MGPLGEKPPHPVRVYGAKRCHKSRFYEEALANHSVAYVLRDVETDDEAARELRLLYPNGALKFPTLLINGKRVRNPRLRELDRVLAHEGLYDPGVVHEPHAQRFVRFMAPQDAFVSYSETEDRITLSHIEVPAEKRGTGLGARLALEVLPLVRGLGKTARITCPFMRRVAASDPQWAAYFGVQPRQGNRHG